EEVADVDARGTVALLLGEGRVSGTPGGAVVVRPALRIAEHPVRLVYLPEPPIRAGLPVHVRVVPPGHQAVRLLQLLRRGVAGDAEHVVVVTPHRGSPAHPRPRPTPGAAAVPRPRTRRAAPG